MDNSRPSFLLRPAVPRLQKSICPRCGYRLDLEDKQPAEDATKSSLGTVNRKFLTGYFGDIARVLNTIPTGAQLDAPPTPQSPSGSFDAVDTSKALEASDVNLLAAQERMIPRIPGSPWAYPAKFIPPSPTSTPLELFPKFTNYNHTPPISRFVHRLDLRACLVFVDGVFLDKIPANPKEG
ncbi:hypothetical protein F5Y13DRAFT_172689 [Hypoxylon sp. FL1857]|nr:hypothetical protein F5Y13DRAFT_172689 [Hypoxylon sp. FL1857]